MTNVIPVLCSFRGRNWNRYRNRPFEIDIFDADADADSGPEFSLRSKVGIFRAGSEGGRPLQLGTGAMEAAGKVPLGDAVKQRIHKPGDDSRHVSAEGNGFKLDVDAGISLPRSSRISGQRRA